MRVGCVHARRTGGNGDDMRIEIMRTALSGLDLLRREPAMAGAILVAQVLDVLIGIAINLTTAPPPAGAGIAIDLTRTGGGALVSLVVLSLANCAIFRALLRPDERSLFRFRLGMAEVRMFALVLLMVVIIAAAVAVYAVGANLLFKVDAVWGAMDAMILFAFLTACGLALASVMVRLSLAGPKTFVDRRLRPLLAWRMLSRRFWPMAGVFAIVGVLVALLYATLLLVFSLAASLLGLSPDIGGVTSQSYTTLAEAFSAERLLFLAISTPISTLGILVLTAPGASVLAQLMADTPDRRAEVFD